MRLTRLGGAFLTAVVTGPCSGDGAKHCATAATSRDSRADTSTPRRARRRRLAIPARQDSVSAKELPDGTIPPPDATGNFSHRPDSQSGAGNGGAGRRAAGNDLQLHDELGRQQDLSWHRARRRNVRHPDPDDPAKLVVTTSHPAPYTRDGRGLRAQAIASPAPPRPSSSAPTAPIRCCSRRWTI